MPCSRDNERADAEANVARETDNPRGDSPDGTRDRTVVNQTGNEVDRDSRMSTGDIDMDDRDRNDVGAEESEGRGWERKRRAGNGLEDQEESQPRRASKKWRRAIDDTVSERVTPISLNKPPT